MTTSSLVLMAAGLGSRFGGVKQLAEIGPNGESLLDFTIKDAQSVGIDHVVIIVRSEIADDMESHLKQIHGANINVDFALQDLSAPQRRKPWGTAHAVLSASKHISNPFILANADDYYGVSSIVHAANHLPLLDESSGALISFELSKTLSETGSVTRGICTTENNQLQHVIETEGLIFDNLSNEILDGEGNVFAPATPVSMNLWAFHSSIIDLLESQWEEFIAENSGSETAECLLPSCIAEIMKEEGYQVHVTPSSETWTGITNPEDLESVRENIKAFRG
ncbi:MAG TPA: NTP transferase domain-containing protein [Acidimicrobiales bacterium]|nr:NTP transferase domain-containing protein [Acidimicrobiales bacterium]